jgi:hypothetical protein
VGAHSLIHWARVRQISCRQPGGWKCAAKKHGRTRKLRRSAFRCVKELEKTIEEYLATNNAQPKPFVWTASADLILGKVKSVCERINQSEH